MTDAARPVARLIGVYDADGTVLGELSYFIGARLGRRHCALCDITHGLVRERADWRACQAQIPLPFDLVHRDEQSRRTREAAGGRAPVIVAETTGGDKLLLGPTDIAACDGDPSSLVDAIEHAARDAELEWPAA